MSYSSYTFIRIIHRISECKFHPHVNQKLEPQPPVRYSLCSRRQLFQGEGRNFEDVRAYEGRLRVLLSRALLKPAPATQAVCYYERYYTKGLLISFCVNNNDEISEKWRFRIVCYIINITTKKNYSLAVIMLTKIYLKNYWVYAFGRTTLDFSLFCVW